MRLKPRLIALAAGAALLFGCASQKPLRDMEPGERPPEDTDEAGLWTALDESELALQRSPLLVHDPALNAYVKKLVCDLADSYCRDIRVYIVRRPYFNASMAPNGVMQVWTGALLRSENEAQLGFVLGHEIGHFLHQHSIKQWRRTKDIMNALSILQLVAARSGTQDAYDIFDVSQLVAYASLYKYSRDAERESDTEGFERAVKLGYRADQGALLWQGLLAEDNARDRNKPSGIFATHPATEERMTTLREAAEAFVERRQSYRRGDLSDRHRTVLRELAGRRARTASLPADDRAARSSAGTRARTASRLGRVLPRRTVPQASRRRRRQARHRRLPCSDARAGLSAHRAPRSRLHVPHHPATGAGRQRMAAIPEAATRRRRPRDGRTLPLGSDRSCPCESLIVGSSAPSRSACWPC
jgi:hypothetical protein